MPRHGLADHEGSPEIRPLRNIMTHLARAGRGQTSNAALRASERLPKRGLRSSNRVSGRESRLLADSRPGGRYTTPGTLGN